MKGIITEIKGNEVVVLNERGQFVRIINKNYSVGQKIYCKNKTSYKYFYYFAASLIFFIMISYTGYSLYYTPTSYISIDINPSFQLELNRFNKVINSVPFNDDAKAVLEKIKVKHHSPEDSVDVIVNASKEMGYLNESNNYVEIDVLSTNEEIKDEITKSTEKYKTNGIEVSVDKSNESEFEFSKEMGVSLGRAKAIIKYTETFGGDVKNNSDKLSDTSVGKIIKAIKAQNYIENKADKSGQAAESSDVKPQSDKIDKIQSNKKIEEIKEEVKNQNIKRENEEIKDEPTNNEAKTVKPDNKPANSIKNVKEIIRARDSREKITKEEEGAANSNAKSKNENNKK